MAWVTDLFPGAMQFAQQAQHFFQRRSLIVDVGKHQALVHVGVQRIQLQRDITALFGVERGVQTFQNNGAGLGYGGGFLGDDRLHSYA